MKETELRKIEEDQGVQSQSEQAPLLKLSCIPTRLALDTNNKKVEMNYCVSDYLYRLLIDASVLYEQGEFNESKMKFEQYLRFMPNNARAWNLCGACYWNLNEIEAANFAFENASKLAPENTEYLSDLVTFLEVEKVAGGGFENLKRFFAQYPQLRYDVFLNLKAYGVEPSLIQSAWKRRKQYRLKVLSGCTITNGSQMKE